MEELVYCIGKYSIRCEKFSLVFVYKIYINIYFLYFVRWNYIVVFFVVFFCVYFFIKLLSFICFNWIGCVKNMIDEKD